MTKHKVTDKTIAELMLEARLHKYLKAQAVEHRSPDDQRADVANRAIVSAALKVFDSITQDVERTGSSHKVSGGNQASAITISAAAKELTKTILRFHPTILLLEAEGGHAGKFKGHVTAAVDRFVDIAHQHIVSPEAAHPGRHSKTCGKN